MRERTFFLLVACGAVVLGACKSTPAALSDGGFGLPAGSACASDDQCAGPGTPRCIEHLAPLEAIIDPSDGFHVALSAQATVHFPGGYCSTEPTCVTDADCGQGGACFYPLEHLTAAEFDELDSALPTVDFSSFYVYGACLKGCSDHSECRAGYVCDAPIADILELIPAPEQGWPTFCIGLVEGSCQPNPCLHGTCEGGGDQRVVCDCDQGWEGDRCEVPIGCGGLRGRGPLSVSMTGTTAGSLATYACADGFELSGGATRTCGADDVWSGGAPSCVRATDACHPSPCLNGGVCAIAAGEAACTGCADGYAGALCEVPVDCGAPPGAPPLVVSAGPTTLGSAVSYTCEGDLFLSGDASRSCLADGSWSGTTPSCIDPPETCEPNPCQEGGSCVSDGNGHFESCDCPAGTTGLTCEAEVDCGALVAMAPLEVLAPTTAYESLATYGCAAGHTLVGAATRSCQLDGNWSGTAPTCAARNCGSPTPPTHGAVDVSGGTTYGDTALYSCDPGYDRVGTETRVCGEDGSWSGSAPSCQLVDCGGLAAPVEGSVDTSAGTTYPAMATYACTTGYALEGDATRSCQASGSWSGAAPTCVLVDCGALGAPLHGSVAVPAGTTHGQTASYTCDLGYQRSGSASRTCQADASWSGSAPTCEALDCGTLAAPSDGFVDLSDGTTFGVEAVYGCNEGYLVSGDTTRTCDGDGNWSGSAPSCGPVSCGGLASPSNGSVDTSSGTSFQDVATYACSAGFDLDGAASRTCGADASWSGTAPSCVVRDCGGLTAPSNGSVDTATGTTVGETATYACVGGFQLSGSPSRTCQASGTWSGAAPSCEAIPDGCDPHPCANGGTCTESGGTFTGCTDCDAGWTGSTCDTPVDCGGAGTLASGTIATPDGTSYGAVATYTCATGYTRTGDETRTCQADGAWSGALPTCTIVDCGGLGAPADGSVNTSGGTTYNQVATYACDAGYGLSGTGTRTCAASGSWTGTAPTCAPVDCGGLGSPTHGSVSTSGGTTLGTTATYACTTGYVLVGAAERTCQTSGSWSGSAPSCAAVDCGSPDAPASGSVATPSGTSYGAVATYACATGYTRSGDASRTCESDGTWSGSVPTCTIVSCGNLPAPANGVVDTSDGTTYLAEALYGCDAGYALTGSALRTCGANGTWSGSAPSCVPVDCGGLGAPANGSVDTSTGTTLGSTAAYACSTGYALTGDTSRTCQSNGTWSGSTPTCSIVDCGGLSATSPLLVSAPVTTYDALATYSCSAGYQLQGGATRACQANGSWSGSAPTCAVVTCGALGAPANGAVDTSGGTAFGATATYSCSGGYDLQGAATRTCQSNGSWSGSAPTCASSVCGDYTDIVYRVTARFQISGTTLGIGNQTFTGLTSNAATPPFVGANMSTPFVGSNTGGTFTHGFVRLRFTNDANGNPVAGTVRLVEWYVPLEFTQTAGATLYANNDHSVGILQNPSSLANCGGGDTTCSNRQPNTGRACLPNATGTLAGTSLAWGACTNWSGNNNWNYVSARAVTGAGCATGYNQFGNNTTSSSLVPASGKGDIYQTYNQRLSTLTFSSTNYLTATWTMPDIQIPNGTGQSNTWLRITGATPVATDCGTTPGTDLLCNLQ